jgi:pimeloyl-ACP methyl ester carboxylesterase
VLKQTTRLLESIPALEHDWFARACVRVAYYLSCPATREAFLSAARELALDPAYGANGTWTRLEKLKMPVVFLWAGRDRLIPATHAEHVAETLPEAAQLTAPCSGHFVNFTHFRCMERAVKLAAARILDAEEGVEVSTDPILTPCLAGGVHETLGEPESFTEPPAAPSVRRNARA